MSEDFENRELRPKEYGKRTLNAARLYSLLRREGNVQDPWHVMVLGMCAFEGMHIRDGWEFALANRQDIEDVAGVFERANSPQEFREGLIELKEQDLMERLERLEGNDI
ncbi:MAG: hypothetical protein QOI57_1861 [Rubrobacteraceae bacterium]|jgi:hypothetical protein|nr:hypothetical protein [Rubrobacteraceae bacterium]